MTGQWKPATFRDVMGRFATGVTVLTVATPEREMHAMTANAFMSVSLDPPLAAVSVALKTRMSAYVTTAARIGINVLAADQASLCRHFGGRPDPQMSVPVDWIDGVPFLHDCAARMQVEVEEIHPAGDHRLLVARIIRMDCWDRGPLLFHRGNVICFPDSSPSSVPSKTELTPQARSSQSPSP